MKKYNFLQEPEDPFFESEVSQSRLSPAAKRLMVIGIVGIVLAGGLYVYTKYFGGTPPPLPRSLAQLERKDQQPTPRAVVEPSQQKEGQTEPVPQRGESFRPSQVREEPITSSQTKEEPVKAPASAMVAQQQVKEAAPPAAEKPPTEQVPQAPPERPSVQTQPQGEKAAKPEPPAGKPTPETRAQAPQSAPQQRADGEKPAPKTVAKATQPEAAAEKGYAVQVASLVRENNALSLKKRLEDMGLVTDVRKITIPITYHRVYAGEFSSREEAERTARQLNVDGFPSTVVTIAGGKFAPEVGSFLRLNQAIDLARTLQTKNHAAKIVSEPTPTPVYQVRVGSYENRAQAGEALQLLKSKGLDPLIVKR